MSDVVELVREARAELDRARDSRNAAERTDAGPIKTSLLEVAAHHERRALELIQRAQALRRDSRRIVARTTKTTADLERLMDEIDRRMAAVERFLKRLRS